MSQEHVVPAAAGEAEFLTTEEAAAFLRKSPKTLERWRKERRGPRYCQPEGKWGSVVYLKADLREYVTAGRVSR